MICIYIYCYISCTLYIAIFNFMSALCIVLSCVFITYICTLPLCHIGTFSWLGSVPH